MRSLRFALAVPRDATARHPNGIEQVEDIAGLCAPRPRLWKGAEVSQTCIENAGLVIGCLFSRDRTGPGQALRHIAPQTKDKKETARFLLQECWGAYLAIFMEPETGAIKVLSDPSGLLPVYRYETGTHIVLVSQPRLIKLAGLRSPRVAWAELRAHICRPELRRKSTCLEGLSELPRGALVDLSCADNAACPLWQPVNFLPRKERLSFIDAAQELRELALHVIGAWQEYLGPVVVAASGGVDSSLICAALASQERPFACATLATSDRSGDERAYVELLARSLGVSAISQIYRSEDFDPLEPASRDLPRPSRMSFLNALDRALGRAAEQSGAAAILDGNGGDNLFCFLHSAAPVADRLRVEGPGRGAWASLLDMCQVTGCDLPTMLRALLRRLVRRRPAHPWPADTRLLRDRQDAEPFGPLTDWLETSVGRHRGKIDHLALIMRAQNQIHTLSSDLPRFSPLMSQPLLEFCLGIPTWTWCEGGINRALARRAFEDELPRALLVRTSKAGPDSFIRRCFSEHRVRLREILLEGHLAQQGILDTVAVELAFEADTQTADSIIYRLLDLAEAEIWSQTWEDQVPP